MVKVIPIVVGALGTVFRNLEKGRGEWKSVGESKPFKLLDC